MSESRQWLLAEVCEKTREAEGVFSYALRPAGPDAFPPITAGSHINVEVREGLIRQYSLCNSPAETDRYVIAVGAARPSRGGSVAMHEDVVVGATIRISRPANNFAISAATTRALLIAGGIGITPLICMAEDFAMRGKPFELHCCTRTRSRTPFIDRITTSPYRNAVTFHFDDGPPDQRLDLPKLLVNPHIGYDLYLCGPAPFMDWVLEAARSHGWPDTRLHREYFVAPLGMPGAGGSFTVRVASTGNIVHVGEEETMLQALLNAGVDIPTSCEQGVCGTCITGVLEGEPDHRDSFLSPEERERNNVVMPCCSRARTTELVLDL